MSALLSLTGRLLWPSLPIKFLWGILLIAIATSGLAGQPKIMVIPLVCLMLLLFCIPLQFIPLSRNRSWLLLPHFRQHSRLLLLTLPLIMALLSGTAMQLVGKGFWLPMQLGLFATAVFILPCLLFGNILPFIFNSMLLALILASNLQQHLPIFSQPLLFGLLTLLNLSLLCSFAVLWLKPGRRLQRSAPTNYQNAGIWQFLKRLTRKSATLHGSLLLGQGDSWRARSLRTLAFCWYLPGAMLLWLQLFSEKSLPEQSIILALFVMFPTFLLVEQLSNMLKRVRRAWLTLPVSRRQLYQILEKQAFKEILLATLIISPLMLLVFPDLATAAAILLLWSSLLLFGMYLSWRLINQSLFWSGLVMVAFNISVITTLVFFWQQPLVILMLASLVTGISALLRQQLKQQIFYQDWGKLKVLASQSIRTGL